MSDKIKNPAIKKIKDLVKNKNDRDAFIALCQLSHQDDDFTAQYKYYQIYKSIDKKQLDLTPLKLAIIPTCTVDHLSHILTFWMAKEGIDIELYLAEYDTIDQTILNPQSELYEFDPDIIWIYAHQKDLKMTDPSEIDSFYIEWCINLWKTIKKSSKAHIIHNNAEIPMERVFGNFDITHPQSRTQMIRKFNMGLSEAQTDGVTIFDMDYLSSLYGKARWNDERYWFHSKHASALDTCGLISSNISRLIAAIKGRSKKCLVLDCDNTLWGGVVADDGLEGIKLGSEADGEAFVAFQEYLLELKNRGIILAVCSKNEEEIAKEPFINHPDMKIKLDDISVFMANWDNKADNIRKIAQVLNIGLDSIVFVDDNPVERDLVHNFIPEVSVCELPQDPSYYIRALDQERYFETISFTKEDQGRTEMYRQEAQRRTVEDSFTDISQYLKSLEMCSLVSEFDPLHLGRIVQLINKSNQFHLTTTRYPQEQVKLMMKDDNTFCRYFKLRDRFGDYGLISVVILKKRNKDELFVDTWLMSCRVLSRGMEDFVSNEIISIAKQQNVQKIVGSYIKTKKNKLVADHYKNLNYNMIEQTGDESTWELILDNGLTSTDIYIDQVTADEYNNSGIIKNSKDTGAKI